MVLDIRRKPLDGLLYHNNQYQNASVILTVCILAMYCYYIPFPRSLVIKKGSAPQISSIVIALTSPGNAMKAARQLGAQSHLIKRAPCRRCQHRSFCLFTCQSVLRQSALPLLPPNRITYRNVGIKLRKSIEELPQGLQTPLEPFIEKEASKYSPVIDEVLQNQRRFPKCVLLTRVGQFYEVCTSISLLILVVLFSSG